MAIPFVTTLVTSPRRFRVLVIAFALGGAALAAYLLVRNPILAAGSFKAGGFASYAQAVVFHGSMTNGQRLVATIAATFLLVTVFRGRFRAQSGWSASLALQCAGFVMNFKRGSWAVAAVIMGALAWAWWRWRAVLAFAALVALLLALPPVRNRVGQLRYEFDPEGGGRLTMWFRVAPAILAEHPFGIGVRALTSETMVAIAPNVEKDRNHLHSNVAQVLVETGWLGFALYLAWMAVSLRDAWRLAGGRDAWPPGGDADRWLPLLALAGLMANGLVEYNMGDAGIVLLYGLFMGMAAAGARWDSGIAACGTASGAAPAEGLVRG
jgi:O-antigen ligase